MGLSEDEKNALIELKIERAKETFSEVPVHIKQGFYRTAASRLYYACYYIVSNVKLLTYNTFCNLILKSYLSSTRIFSLFKPY